MIRGFMVTKEEVAYEIALARGHMSTYESDLAYGQYLKNKHVAVIGPALTLIGKKQGESIDSHDIVVRFNDAFEYLPVSPQLAQDIGTKTDVLYCNQVVLRKSIIEKQNNQQEDISSLLDNWKIKYIICTNNALNYDRIGHPEKDCPKADRNTVSKILELLEKNKIETGFRLVYDASLLLNRWLQDNFGRTGLVAIVDLLLFEIKSLNIMGMTFYHGGGHLFSSVTTELHPLKNRDGSWAKDHTGKGHDSYLEVEVMKLLFSSDQRIRIDHELAKILNTHKLGSQFESL